MQPAALIANRWLDRESWARERLSAHAGRTLRIAIGPATASLAIDEKGRFIEAAAAPDLTLTISPLRLPTFLAHPERWSELVQADGDAPLAATLADLAHTLPWYVEGECAGMLGPIVGTRLADAGRHLLALPEYVAERFGESLASYARDETGAAVRGDDVRDFAAEVEHIATRTDTLAARIEQLGDANRKNVAG
jgi:ubiquinone biosynthesis protein UbiJ